MAAGWKNLLTLMLIVPSTSTARIQEMHIMLGQMLCGAFENRAGAGSGILLMTALQSLIAEFPCLRVLVFGDLMLDQFVYGQVSRISPKVRFPF